MMRLTFLFLFLMRFGSVVAVEQFQRRAERNVFDRHGDPPDGGLDRDASDPQPLSDSSPKSSVVVTEPGDAFDIPASQPGDLLRQSDPTSNPEDRHTDPPLGGDDEDGNRSPIRESQPANNATQIEETRLEEQAATEEADSLTDDVFRIEADRHSDGPGERDVDTPEGETLPPVPDTIRVTAPSTQPSALPSVSPSLSPTASIAPSQSPSTSRAPTVDCTVDSQGNFGDITGPLLTTLLLNYTYEIEIPSTSNITDAILAVERNISEFLLPEFFADRCGNRRRFLQSRRLDVVGMTPEPADNILENENCTSSVSSVANICQVVAGQLLLYLDSADVEDTETSALEAIQRAMLTGELQQAYPEIVRLLYLSSFVPTGTTRSIDQDTGSNRLAWWAWVLIVIAILIILAVIVLAYLFYRSNQNSGARVDSVDDDDDDDDQFKSRDGAQSSESQDDYQPPDTFTQLTP